MRLSEKIKVKGRTEYYAVRTEADGRYKANSAETVSDRQMV